MGKKEKDPICLNNVFPDDQITNKYIYEIFIFIFKRTLVQINLSVVKV